MTNNLKLAVFRAKENKIKETKECKLSLDLSYVSVRIEKSSSNF
jgi:hypothetical protein